MNWKQNPIMEWYDPREGSPTYNQWVKISDHGRSSLSIDYERIENSQRMANGMMRRYVVAKKRTYSCSWENLPNTDTDFLANGQSGEWMEDFHDEVDGAFRMRIRAGSDVDLPTSDPGIEEVLVMFSDYSRETSKRGAAFDLWNVDISLEEV